MGAIPERCTRALDGQSRCRLPEGLQGEGEVAKTVHHEEPPVPFSGNVRCACPFGNGHHLKRGVGDGTRNRKMTLISLL